MKEKSFNENLTELQCEDCGRWIWENDPYYLIDGDKIVCTNCAMDYK